MLFMNGQPLDSAFDMRYLAEGSPEIREFLEPTSPSQPTSHLNVHHQFRVKRPSSKEGLVAHIGAVLEGRDTTDIQDAALMQDETQIHRKPSNAAI